MTTVSPGTSSQPLGQRVGRGPGRDARWPCPGSTSAAAASAMASFSACWSVDLAAKPGSKRALPGERRSRHRGPSRGDPARRGSRGRAGRSCPRRRARARGPRRGRRRPRGRARGCRPDAVERASRATLVARPGPPARWRVDHLRRGSCARLPRIRHESQRNCNVRQPDVANRLTSVGCVPDNPAEPVGFLSQVRGGARMADPSTRADRQAARRTLAIARAGHGLHRRAAPSTAPSAAPPARRHPSAAPSEAAPSDRRAGRDHASARTIATSAQGRHPGDRRLLPGGRPASTVTVNDHDHNDFQDQISSYLQGTPDDVFTWFAGYRLRFFAAQGLLTPDRRRLGRRSAELTPRPSRPRPTGTTARSTSCPIYNYPWVVIYRKSLFEEKGYTVPTTLGRVHGARRQDEDRRPRPARVRRQGRLAGDGHLRHPQHAPQRLRVPRRPAWPAREKWTDPRVKAVFEVGGAPAVLLRTARSGGPGRKPHRRARQRRRRRCTSWARSRASRRRPETSAPTSTSSRSRRSARSSTPSWASTPRSTAFMLSKAPKNLRRRQGVPQVLRHRRRRRSPT